MIHASACSRRTFAMRVGMPAAARKAASCSTAVVYVAMVRGLDRRAARERRQLAASVNRSSGAVECTALVGVVIIAGYLSRGSQQALAYGIRAV